MSDAEKYAIYAAYPPGRYRSAWEVQSFGRKAQIFEKRDDGEWYVDGTLHILLDRFPDDLVAA